ncbi:MAG: hypothetical protein HXY37_03565 [Chloroflexi bacterium]|nr:hypothetical protein [Chloroflexota bacterium]
MPEYQETRRRRASRARQRAAAAMQVEPLERAVGEPLQSPPPAPLSLLRPQHQRNVSWRWHLRRRQRAG